MSIMNKPIISIIVPVYNAEKYIRECVSSIVSQTFKEIEILLVDDGSKDNSTQICDLLGTEDSRIRVFHKANGGASDARNFGIKRADGEYIIFIDADDFIIGEKSLEFLMSNINSFGDVKCLCFNCSYYQTERNELRQWTSFKKDMLNTIPKNKALVDLVEIGSFPCSPCMKLLKRAFIIDNDLYFQPGITAEDIPWFIDILDKADSLRFVDLYAYAYRTNVVGSVTNSSNDYKSFNNLRNVVRIELEKLNDRSFSNEAKNALLSFLGYEYSILLGQVRSLPHNIQEKEYNDLKQNSWLLNYTIHPKVKKVNQFKKIFGLKLTSWFLHYYLKNMKGSK